MFDKIYEKFDRILFHFTDIKPQFYTEIKRYLSGSLRLVVSFSLPWPPSANKYWRMVNNRVITSKEAREYKSAVQHLSLAWESRHLDGRLFLQIIAFPPDRRKRDLDNLLKVTIDSIQATGLFDDDSQIDDIGITRSEPVKNGKLYCTVGKVQ